jgi:hypothetical protein
VHSKTGKSVASAPQNAKSREATYLPTRDARAERVRAHRDLLVRDPVRKVVLPPGHRADEDRDVVCRGEGLQVRAETDERRVARHRDLDRVRREVVRHRVLDHLEQLFGAVHAPEREFVEELDWRGGECKARRRRERGVRGAIYP